MNRILLLASLLVLLVACEGNVFSLESGTCFNDEVLDEVSDVPVVDCAEPHDNEVYLLIDYTESDTFPGVSEIQDWTAERCYEAFEPFVGLAYEASALDIGYLYPSADSWDGGDRESVCFVWEVDRSQMTGSAAGTNR